MTVQMFLDKMKNKLGAPHMEQTVDNVICGDPAQELTGIAVTFMATAEVIRKAAAAGVNLILTHEPTFYNHRDDERQLEGITAFAAKKQLLAESGVCVARVHDGMHAVTPDLIYAGMEKELGWARYACKDHPKVYTLPARSLRTLAGELKAALAVDTVRIVGNADIECSRVGFLVGAYSLGSFEEGREADSIRMMQELSLDVLVCGELIEWTTCAYVRDAAALGENRALAIVGHNRSEEAGMKHFADYIKPLLDSHSLQVLFIEAGDPFTYL